VTYELWDLVSRNLIDYFEDRQDAIAAVQAYVDAGEAALVVLLEHDDTGSTDCRSFSGEALIQWLERARAELQRTA